MEPIIFAGTPDNAARTLRGLIAGGVHVALVVTREDAPHGRKRVLTPSAVAQAAEELGLPVLKTNKIDANALERIADAKARLAIVVAFGTILRQTAIDALELGWFNLHYSLLPRWRGASPVQSALLAGDTETGVTLFKIDGGVDTGRVVASVGTVIETDENSADLLRRLTELGTSLALEQIPMLFAGFARLTEQNGLPTHAPKYSRTDAKLEPSDSARDAANKVRAFNPEPVAWLDISGEPVRVLNARSVPESLSSGVIRDLGGRIVAGFDSGSLELFEVQPAGKNVMKAADWWRGLKAEEVRFE